MLHDERHISGIPNPLLNQVDSVDLGDFDECTRTRTLALHRSLPAYAPTPLHSLQHLAQGLSLANIWVKDESKRFGLNAFKALGASYAIAQHLSETEQFVTYKDLQDETLKNACAARTFVTATDGNHGRAVAWMAQLLGARSVIYMPFGSEQVRLEAIEAYGGQVEILPGSYDDAVEHASAQADKHGWHLIQDMAWENYTQTPLHIMQGYTTLLTECIEQLNGNTPTHVFLQAGVGSFAAAIQASLIVHYGANCPTVVIVEPDAADCFFRSMQIADGMAHSIQGQLKTAMAGLACGTPSALAWPIIAAHSAYFFKCNDAVTEQGMRLLAHPGGNDAAIVSGESGAVTSGLLAQLMQNNAYYPLRDMLGLNNNSKILLISTEGDTDAENFKRITEIRLGDTT